MNTMPGNRIEVGKPQGNQPGYQVAAIINGSVKMYDIVRTSDEAVEIATEYQTDFPTLPIWVNPAAGLNVNF